MKIIILSTVLGLCIGVGSFFYLKKPQADFSQKLVNELPGTTVIAEYQGGQILAKDVQERISPQFAKARADLLQHYIQAAEAELASRFADRLDVETEPVSAAELAQYMKANRIGLEKKAEIENFLAIEKKRIQQQLRTLKLLQDLQFKNKLGAASFEIQENKTMAKKGSDSPKVTVQVFCDFGNPMCNQARIVMEGLINQFKEDVQWVYRHYPVASNQIGDQASLISLCALEQNKFWLIHDLFYDLQNRLNSDELLKTAEVSGLNFEELKKCLQTERPLKLLNSEKQTAESLGINQTPVFFINGQKIVEIEKVAPTVQTLLK